MALVTFPRQFLVDSNGTPRVGAMAHFYESGTTTEITTYTTPDYSVAHTNPVKSVAGGLFPAIYVNPEVNATYKLVITDSDGVTLYSEDNIPAVGVHIPQTAAESTAGVTPTNTWYPEGYIDRYGTNTTPGTTDMTAAIQAAVDVAHAKGADGVVVGLAGSEYLTSSAIVFPLTSRRIRFTSTGRSQMTCNHNGNGIDWIAQNENYSGHTIEHWTINGPNAFLPESGYTPPSNGAGINMNRGTTDNIVTAYNNTLRDVVIQGFKYGLNMRAVIGLNCYGGYIQYNQTGIVISGGQTNANHFFGTHIRYNREKGIYSTGTSGGSLTNATSNTFTSCLLESNIPYPFAPGGNPPADSTAIVLLNSYDFVFTDCYSENHSVSIYLGNGSKGNKFIRHRTAPGGGGTRTDYIWLSGANVDRNEFDIIGNTSSLTEVSVVSDNANQLWNKFSGSGINFISGNILAVLDYSDVKPSQNFPNTRGTGLIRMPSQGFVPNVSEGTGPGQIDTIGSGAATLNMRGIGELQIGNGLTANTTISTLSNLARGSIVSIVNYQDSFDFTLASGTGTGNIVLQNQRTVTMNKFGQIITFYVTGQGKAYEIGRNFSNRKRGIATISDSATSTAITFAGQNMHLEPDNQYRVIFWVESVSGTPAAGAWLARASSRATTGFTVNLQAAPGAGNSITFGWEVLKLDS